MGWTAGSAAARRRVPREKHSFTQTPSRPNTGAPSGGAGEASESVALGKISVRAAVNVTFELKR